MKKKVSAGVKDKNITELDSRTAAQILLEKAKIAENQKRTIPVRVGKTIYLIPEGCDVEKRLNDKRRMEELSRNNSHE